MIFAFDMDSTITHSPELFSVLSHALKRANHTVYIITGRDIQYFQNETEQYLKNQNIIHDGIFYTYDKLKKAIELGVDYAFDDTPLFYGVEKPNVPYSILDIQKLKGETLFNNKK